MGISGDEIFSVNGRSVAGLTHSEAIGIFKETKVGAIQVTIGRRETTKKTVTMDDDVQCWTSEFSSCRTRSLKHERENWMKTIEKHKAPSYYFIYVADLCMIFIFVKSHISCKLHNMDPTHYVSYIRCISCFWWNIYSTFHMNWIL